MLAAVIGFGQVERRSVQKFEQGNQFFRMGDYDTAIARYTEAIRSNSDCAAAYYNRSIAFRMKGGFDKSIADCAQAISSSLTAASEGDAGIPLATDEVALK
jgi:tetratricopeptide (TPR) repeat protein